jgi:hypothetical protein
LVPGTPETTVLGSRQHRHFEQHFAVLRDHVELGELGVHVECDGLHRDSSLLRSPAPQ